MSADAPSLPSPGPRIPSRASAFLAWIVIVGLVGLVVYANARSSEAADYDKLLNDERSRMIGMLVVQLKAVEKEAGGSALLGQRLQTLIAQAEEEARTPEDKVRIAILAGESLGSEAALSRLSQIKGADASGRVTDDIRSIRTIYEQGPDALTPTERDNLVRRHGYLGRLALAHDVPTDQEPRKTLQSEALWFTVRLSVLGVGLAVLMGASLILFVTACVWFFKGRIRKAYVPDPSFNNAFLEGFALYLIIFVALGVLLRSQRLASVQWTWVAIVILPIVWMWAARRGATVEQRVKGLGWYRGRGFFREAAAGVAGYLAGLAVIAVGCMVTYVLVRYTGIRASSPVVRELNGGPLQLVGLYALACVFAPVMEESMFRGALFHHLRQRWGWAASAFVVSLIFAILHPQGWVALPALFSIAIVLAALREWRGSLIAPMAAHACSNFLVLTAALLLIR